VSLWFFEANLEKKYRPQKTNFFQQTKEKNKNKNKPCAIMNGFIQDFQEIVNKLG